MRHVQTEPDPGPSAWAVQDWQVAVQRNPDLTPKGGSILVIYISDTGELRKWHEAGEEALADINRLNNGDFSGTSIEEHLLDRGAAEGIISEGTVEGDPT